ALLVRHVVVRRGEEHPAVVTRTLRGKRDLAQPLGQPAELRRGEDVEAPLLPLGHHQALRQLVAELGRQEQPALVVEARGVRAEEHPPPPPAVATSPRYSTT